MSRHLTNAELDALYQRAVAAAAALSEDIAEWFPLDEESFRAWTDAKQSADRLVSRLLKPDVTIAR